MVSPAPLDLDVVCSPEWCSGILGAPVVEVERVEELVTIASKVRFRVTYDDGTTDALCVKGYFSPDSAGFVDLGQLEVHFYESLAPAMGLEVPECVHTGIDPGTGHGIIVMRDLVDAGCTFLTPLHPYTPDQTAATLGQLARLHHTDPRAIVGEVDWLAPRLAGYLAYVPEERLQALLDDGRSAPFAPEIADARRLRAAFTTVAERAAARPEHVVHGDSHAGNLYLTPDGRPGLVDWQVIQLGPWSLDVAYHIGAVLDPADRERSEADLVREYLEARRALGDDVPDFASAWDDYRDALVYGFYMWAITQRVARPVLEEHVARLGRAVEHHDSFARLGS